MKFSLNGWRTIKNLSNAKFQKAKILKILYQSKLFEFNIVRTMKHKRNQSGLLCEIMKQPNNKR